MKNFAVSFLIVLAAFSVGRYVFPSEESPLPVVETVAFEEATVVERAASPETSPVDDGETSIYTPSELHTIRLFENASPSVCYITTKVRQRDFWSFNVQEVPAGSGSGFVWDDDGHIITNYHVIRGASQAVVTLANGNDYQATLVGVAKEKDLAVLKIEAPARDLQPIPVGSSEDIRVGQAVYAIGNPFGLDQTLTTGIVSALDREIKSQANVPIRGVIQTDAAINPGNSGGPLLDSKGFLIGVNTAIYSPSGASAGIGFSIPVDEVRYVVPDLIRYGEVRRASLGAEFRQYRGYMVVTTVDPGSAAGRAGIRGLSRDSRGYRVLGDILVGINGKPVKSQTDLYLELEKYDPGEYVTLSLIRDEREVSLEVQLDSTVD